MRIDRGPEGEILATLTVDEVMAIIRAAICVEAGEPVEGTVSREFFAIQPEGEIANRTTHFTMIVDRRPAPQRVGSDL